MLALLLATVAVQASLTVTVWPEGRPGEHQRYTLRCAPAAGTLPRRGDACDTLERVGRAAFLPVPDGTACTDLYGGPQEAIVAGTLGGRRVWARFRRNDGCQIARWNRVSPLLPIG